MSSLQDQLLKAGLVDKKQAHQARAEKRKNAKKKRKGQLSEDNSLQQQIEAQKAQKLAKDKALADEKAKEKLGKEKLQQLEQLIKSHALAERKYKGDEKHNFAFNNLVKTIYLNPEAKRRVIKGIYGICEWLDKFYLFEADSMQRLEALAPELVALFNKPEEKPEEDEDDPYAGYEVPDDLMW